MQAGVEPQVHKKGTFRLEGRVVDEQGGSVADARVWVHPGDEEIASASDGSFVLEQLVAGRYRISATKDELYSAWAAPVTVDRTSAPVTVQMRRGATLLVRVVDNGAAPVQGAKVVHHKVNTLSDATGVARVQGLGPGFQIVEVTADGFAPDFLSMRLADDPGALIERTVMLRRGASANGVVLGPDGGPVPDAIVEIWESGNRWGGRATCDHAGAWVFDTLGSGTYRLCATSTRYCPAPDVTIELDGLTARHNIVLSVDAGATLTGTVIDASGQPVADATVIANIPPARMPESYRTRTDACGRYQMLGIKVGAYHVFAHDGDRASPPAQHALAHGDHGELDLVLQDASIAGIVVDTTGLAVADARVNASSGEHLSRVTFGEHLTDADGRFALFGLPPGEYALRAAWPDQGTRRCRRDDVARVQSGDTTVRLVLPRPATLTGRVLLDGAPMPYYGILLTESPQYPWIGEPIGTRSADGRFTVSHVAPGTWGIVVLGPGTARTTIADIAIEDGTTIDLGDIVMTHGHRISGHVRDAVQRPVDGARVTIGRRDGMNEDELHSWFHSTFETTTDATGAYVFDGVAPLRSTISAIHPACGASLATQIPAGDVTIDLTLLAVGSIDGVVDGFSERFGAVTIRRNDQPDTRVAQVDRSGRFHVDGLPVGEYTIDMMALPGTTTTVPSITINVAADQCAMARLVTSPVGES